MLFMGCLLNYPGCLACFMNLKVQGCFKGVSRGFHGCFKGVSRVFHGCFKGVSRVFKGI